MTLYRVVHEMFPYFCWLRKGKFVKEAVWIARVKGLLHRDTTRGHAITMLLARRCTAPVAEMAGKGRWMQDWERKLFCFRRKLKALLQSRDIFMPISGHSHSPSRKIIHQLAWKCQQNGLVLYRKHHLAPSVAYRLESRYHQSCTV
jgi:hypothetical protein